MNRVSSIALPQQQPQTAAPWWKGAAIYQIYPRSFLDTNGDGIGDLKGITQRLDHVASLGVDAIWISPFFTSPMADFGYDVADYRDVDPIFGTLADFDELLARAHALGLRVTIDLVFSHTSDQHAWFTQSRQRRDGEKADWFVWADAKPDGSPPSNWQSVFGGPAWTWDARRRQYYLHNFLAAQPQLNCHNRAVQDALLDVARFWLDRGVDGFRLDALNFSMHDPQLRDNPPTSGINQPPTRPFDFQEQLYNQSHPDIPLFLERIRSLTDEYGAIFTVAEVGGKAAAREMKLFTQGAERLNSAYGFEFLYAPALSPELVAHALQQWPDEAGIGWPSWAFENHDAPRALSRWCTEGEQPAFARFKMALLVALRGNIILYQGEELGLTQVDVPYEKLQDPEAIANWPLTLSRDGARTPMPWSAAENEGGFTQGEPWLPLGTDNINRAVDQQEQDHNSLLHFTRAMLALRRDHPALQRGDVHVCEVQGPILRLDRGFDGAKVRCLFNFSDQEISVSAEMMGGHLLYAINGATPVALPAYGALFIATN